MSAPYWWKYLCADPDDCRPELESPWIVGEHIYASDGKLLVCGPAAGHRIDPADPPRVFADARKILDTVTLVDGHTVRLWTLMKWAGPLLGMNVPCEGCNGMGTAGWVDLHADEPDLVGPNTDRPDAEVVSGSDCECCDGSGWCGPRPDPVSIYGVVVDAHRLARALWALPRLDHAELGGEVRVYPDGQRVGFVYGKALVVLMGMNLRDGTLSRAWPVATP